MHNLDSTKELSIRNWIRDRIVDVDPDLPVMITPFYFATREDFVGQLYNSLVPTLNYDTFEPSFSMITFLRFSDSLTMGCDDDPVTFLLYNIHLFKFFKDVRGNATNSYDELLEMFWVLRNKFLDETQHPVYGENVKSYALTMPTIIQRRAQSEYLRNEFGSIINVEVKVEVR